MLLVRSAVEVLWKCCGPLLLVSVVVLLVLLVRSAVECCWLEVLWTVAA